MDGWISPPRPDIVEVSCEVMKGENVRWPIRLVLDETSIYMNYELAKVIVSNLQEGIDKYESESGGNR